MARAKTTNGCHKIDEDIQKPVRSKLKLLRELTRKSRYQVTALSYGSVFRYEEEDISSLKLGDAINIAFEYGMNPQEFFNYLFGDIDYTDIVRRHSGNIDTIAIQARDLSPDDQKMVVSLIVAMREHRRSEVIGNEMSQIAKRTTPRVRSKRSRLTEARAAVIHATAEATGDPIVHRDQT